MKIWLSRAPVIFLAKYRHPRPSRRRETPQPPHPIHVNGWTAQDMLQSPPDGFRLMEDDMYPALVCEFLGTFWLVLGGCGAAVLAAGFPYLGIGFMGVALAFGLTVLTGAYTFGPVSGAHFNPAVTLGLWSGGRFPSSRVPAYIAAQLAGAIVASAALFVIASGHPAFDVNAGFAANGYGL